MQLLLEWLQPAVISIPRFTGNTGKRTAEAFDEGFLPHN